MGISKIGSIFNPLAGMFPEGAHKKRKEVKMKTKWPHDYRLKLYEVHVITFNIGQRVPYDFRVLVVWCL